MFSKTSKKVFLKIYHLDPVKFLPALNINMAGRFKKDRSKIIIIN